MVTRRDVARLADVPQSPASYVLSGRRPARSRCDAIVLTDIETHDARIPVAAGPAVPVIPIGVPADPHGPPRVDLDSARAGRPAVDHEPAGHQRLAGAAGGVPTDHARAVPAARPRRAGPGARRADRPTPHPARTTRSG
ncbi:hypothetical protein GCM10020358_55370 [Amorphoplanes nipponensis]|uniref:Uncharacterized protein n=1 Tax=Actinoplanes nipponensis TaxID=135950 RepID=A0A919MY74_9ACTN|nr:hypothetical protein Ani05nite_77340 [Actinoplanes nipponensis]